MLVREDYYLTTCALAVAERHVHFLETYAFAITNKRSDIHNLCSQIWWGSDQALARIRDEKGWGTTRAEKRDASSLIIGYIINGYDSNIDIYKRAFWSKKTQNILKNWG